MSLAKANLSPWGGKRVSAVWLNSFFVAAKSFLKRTSSPFIFIFIVLFFFYFPVSFLAFFK